MQHRVVMVTSDFPSFSETFVVTKVLGLLRRGWDVQVVTGVSEDAEWTRFPELEAAGVRSRVHVTADVATPWRKITRIPPAAARSLFRPAAWRYLQDDTVPLRTRLRRWFLDEPLIRLQPDLVHFQFGAHAVGRTHVKRLLGCRIVVSFRGYDLHVASLTEPGLYHDVWRDTDALHVVSHDLWERAQEHGCPPSKRHALIPGGVDLEYFRPDPSPREDGNGTVRILSVGRLVWQKGYEYALQAVAQLRERGISCRYRIVGDGDAGWLRFTRHDLDLDDIVELTGPLAPEQVREELRAADIFLQASVTEGSPVSTMEAQAMQVPIVCADGGGLPENVADGETGFVVPRRDPGALADGLEQLARDPALRRRMGEAGRRRADEYFDMDDQITALEQLYQQALNART